jgi:hypothetical protein
VKAEIFDNDDLLEDDVKDIVQVEPLESSVKPL